VIVTKVQHDLLIDKQSHWLKILLYYARAFSYACYIKLLNFALIFLSSEQHMSSLQNLDFWSFALVQCPGFITSHTSYKSDLG